MKIAFVTPQMIVGGAETYIVRKSEWLIKRGHDVIVISAGGCYVDQLPEKVSHYEIKELLYAPYSMSGFHLMDVLKKISDIIKKESVDVIEAHNAFPVLYITMSYSFHGCPFLLNALLELNYDGNYQLCLLTKLLSKRSRYFTLTLSMNDYIERKCKARLSPHILPIPINAPSDLSITEEKYLLSVGRMGTDKMYIKHLIVSFCNLKKNRIIDSEVKLVIVGDGNLYGEVNEMASQANRELNDNCIILKGTVIGQELSNLYKCCMAYIGVGTTLLIAASFAKPIILASGFYEFQPFAFGYWGAHYDLDKHSLGGGPDYLDCKMSFEQAILEIVRSQDFRKELSVKSYSLFKEVYDMDKIMFDWESFFKKNINVLNDNILALWGKVFLLLNICLYPIYKLYKIIK